MYIGKPVLLYEGPAGRWKPCWDCSMCHSDPLLPPTPYFYLSDMWWELYTQSPEEKYLSTQCHCHLVSWHTSSRRIIIVIISNMISLLHPTQRRVIWPFFRLSLCLFSVRSLGFPGFFSNSPFERLWPPLTLSSLPPGHHENHLICVPPLTHLVFEHLWPPLTRYSLLSDCPKNHLIWVDSIRAVLLGLWKFSPLTAFLGWFTYIVHWAFLYVSHSISIKFLSMFIWIFNSTVHLWINFQFSTKLFDDCSFFWSWKCIPGISIPLWSNHVITIFSLSYKYKTHLLPS